MTKRYPIKDMLIPMCKFAELDTARVLRRAGMPADWAEQDCEPVTGDKVFALWNAMRLESDAPDLETKLAKAYAHGPFAPPLLAFSCAETVGAGLARLATFKPLLGPFALALTKREDGIALRMVSTLPEQMISPSMELFEFSYILECARTYSGCLITPTHLALTQTPPQGSGFETHTGRTPVVADRAEMRLSLEDASRPLISRSAALWESVEPMLTRQLDEQNADRSTTTRVRNTLVECLPGGASSADQIARRLALSKRSLQRKLSAEGTNFQAILNEVRAQMAETYLESSDISVPEISHLLGFRDTSSFFRAFQSWTGQTPRGFRESGRAQNPEARLS